MRFTGFFIAFLFTLSTVHAAEQVLATITSDIDKDTTEFRLITKDNGDMDSLRFVSMRPGGQVDSDDTYPVETVIRQGVVLNEHNGYKALILYVENFTAPAGGTVKLDYLYSGVNGSRRVVRFVAGRNETGFNLKDPQGKDVNRFFIAGNWNHFFGLVGIREIRSSYKAPGLE